MEKRPYRVRMFEAFARELRDLPSPRILELGSGPGFLAEQLLSTLQPSRYLMLDFSPAMHALARERLGAPSGVESVERSFKEPGWTRDLGVFDAVITMQAVHELRHKRHAVALHREVRTLLQGAGCYLVCDHFAGEGGMRNEELYMTCAEQCSALRAAGFREVHEVVRIGSLTLHRATP
jgi:SAM-dependent methyltransferase